MPPPETGIVRLGKYRVDLAGRRVFNGGGQLPLTWRTFEALRLLIEAQGRVVEKEKLFERLWPGLTVEESSLTKCIGQLRKALSDGEESEDYLETVPRLGYRLAVPALPEEAAPAVRGGRRKLAWALAGLSVACLGGGAGWQWWTRRATLAEAEKLYQEGARLRRLADPASIQAAVENLRRATKLNSGNARYFATLAEVLGRVTSSQRLDRTLVREAAERAVQLDPRCSGCQAVLGFTLFSLFWEWEQAERHLGEALKLDPQDGGLRGYWAMFACSQGRFEEALSHIEARILDQPYSTTTYQIKSVILHCMRRYPEAVATADRAISINPNNKGAWDWRAHALLLDGREREALTAYLEVGWGDRAHELEALYRAAGLPAVIRKLLDLTSGSKEQSHLYRRAQWKMYLRDHSGALEDLEAAYRRRHFNMMYVGVDPAFDPIRSQARFQKILADMKLPAITWSDSRRQLDPKDRASR